MMVFVYDEYPMKKVKKLLKNPTLFFYDALKKRVSDNTTIIKKPILIPQKTSQEYFRELYTFIKYYNINSMKIDDEYIWPYLRNHLISNLYEISLGKQRFLELDPFHLQNGHYSQVSQEFRKLLKKNYEAKELDEIENTETDFLFFVPMNGFGRTEINNNVYHRIVDPLFKEAQEMGKAMKIEVIKNSHLPAIKYWHKYAYKSLIVLPNELTKSGYSQKLNFDNNFFKMFKKYIPSLSTPDRKLLNDVIDFELNTRDFYIKLLKKLKPKVICLYAYHFNAPLISAAHELGILSVDLQHGLQVGWGPIYNNHEELPISGYQSYPDIFAVWGSKEFQHISNTFTSLKHKAIYMGNPWLNTLSTFPDELSESLKNKLQSKKTTILIILQDQLTVPSILKEIMQISDTNILWVIRHHPSAKKKFINKDFTTKNNILIDIEIDKIRFNELFKYIDIAISEGSALSYEASYYSVENILTGSLGYENYKDEIRNGQFYFMKNSKEFSSILFKINSKEFKKTKKLFANTSPRETLSELLYFSKKLIQDRPTKESNTSIPIIKNHFLNIEKHLSTRNMNEALNSFFILRSDLLNLNNIQRIYEEKIDYAMKETKIYKRVIQELPQNNPSNMIYLIGDSICLPRKGSNETASMMIHEMSHEFNISTWGQRYLETNKLLAYWSHIVQNIANEHVVIHLGITDCFPRVYTEKQSSGLNLLPKDLRDNIVKFSSHYQKEILANQKENSYVSLNEFTYNIEQIIQKLILQKPKSITFINIINHPKLNIDAMSNFNDVIDKITLKFPTINILDFDTILKHKGYDKHMLDDHIHLNIQGHKLLVQELITLLNTQDSINE